LRRDPPASDERSRDVRGVEHLEELVERLLADASAANFVGVTPVAIVARTVSDGRYVAKAGRLGVLYVRQQPDDVFAFLERADRITYAIVDADAIRAGLALAQTKWKAFKVSGTERFVRESIRQAVLLGVDDRLVGLSLEMEQFRRGLAGQAAEGRISGSATSLASLPVPVSATPSSKPAVTGEQVQSEPAKRKRAGMAS
jgi:hypothetical protein